MANCFTVVRTMQCISKWIARFAIFASFFHARLFTMCVELSAQRCTTSSGSQKWHETKVRFISFHFLCFHAKSILYGWLNSNARHPQRRIIVCGPTGIFLVTHSSRYTLFTTLIYNVCEMAGVDRGARERRDLSFCWKKHVGSYLKETIEFRILRIVSARLLLPIGCRLLNVQRV